MLLKCKESGMNYKLIIGTLSLATIITSGLAHKAHADIQIERSSNSVYRLYNPNTGEHFYTENLYEQKSLSTNGWRYEGVGWQAAISGTAVYRVYNPNARGGDHYYTMSKYEAQSLVNVGWRWDNNGKAAFYSGGSVNLYVAYNPNANSGSHNYTTNTYEQNSLLGKGWKYGKVAWKTMGISPVIPHVPVANPWKYVISHRGGTEPVEHTFAAYDLAIQQGSKNIEQDVVVSKNKTLYVSHDLSSKRLTGVDKLYSDMTDEEISKLKVANGEPIHTLQSIFERYGNKVNYIVEIKANDPVSQVVPFITMVRQYGLENNVVSQSFVEGVLNKVSVVAPDMPQMRLVSTQTEFDNALNSSVAHTICMAWSIVNKANVDRVHKQNRIASAFTLDTEASIKSAISLGVDNYFTNYTGRAIQLEKEYR